MQFSEYIIEIMKRLAKIEGAFLATRINENGVLTVQLVASYDGDIATIYEVSEDSTEGQRAAFERRVDLLENAIRSQDAEDAAHEAKVREVLNKLTKEERILIERPLPEEMIPESDGDEGVSY